MKLLMLCKEPRLYSCQRLKQAAESFGYTLDILDPNRFILALQQGRAVCYYQAGRCEDNAGNAPDCLPNYQGLLGRFGVSSMTAGCNILRHFEQQGIPLLNGTSAFELARDKWRSLQQLNAFGIPIPQTMWQGSLVDSQTDILDEYGLPVVIKTLTGSQGVGVMLGESRASVKSIVETLKQATIPTLIQQFVPDALGKDIRAFVIGDQVVAAMSRQAKNGEFRANIHQGGSADRVELSDVEMDIAVKATQSIGLEVAGVDLIRTKQGVYVLEVNATPGLEMIEKISQVDIAEKMIAYLLSKIK